LESIIMEASMGYNGPSAWNQIYVSFTLPTFMCKLVGADLRSNLKSTCVYNSS
jgi:hypothetical protein